MDSTPGFIVPSLYSSQQELEEDLRRRSEAAGFTPFEPFNFIDDTIEHIGVKGMHWGVRKSENSPPPSNARKVAVKVGGSLLTALGAAIAVGIFAKTGNFPAKPTNLTNRKIAKGKTAMRKIQSRSEWKRDVNAVLKDIEKANAHQDRWMRSLGLGAVINNR